MKYPLLVLAALATTTSVFAAKWDQINNPHKFARLMKSTFATKFNTLPLSAKLTDEHFIWSDTFWPSNKGGISYRWNAEPYPQNFVYKSPSKDELFSMSMAEKEALSPTEKMDIFEGNYRYPLTKQVRKLYKPTDLWWEGICHGWAMASISHAEPQRVVLTNKDGIQVPFGSSDVKGLLSFYYANVQKPEQYSRIGNRCKANGKVPGEAYDSDRYQEMPSERERNSADCADTNAGAFHLVLTNMIGRLNHGFVADVDRFNDVWNQPVGQFSSKIVGTRVATPTEASQGVASAVRIQTEMTYGEELNLLPYDASEEGGFMSMDPVTGTHNQTFSSRNYDYWVELDAAGNIIGGSWISESRPDFLWIRSVDASFVKAKGFDFRALNSIYRPYRD